MEEGQDRWKIDLECARMDGDDIECSRIEGLLLDRLPDSERASILVRGAIALHDDRLPGPLNEELAIILTDRLDSDRGPFIRNERFSYCFKNNSSIYHCFSIE